MHDVKEIGAQLVSAPRSTKEKEKRHYQPFSYLARQLEGIRPGDLTDLQPITFDSGNSRIYGALNGVHYQAGVNKALATDGKDIVLIGYTHQGLPFQVVVNGLDDSIIPTEFVKVHVVSRLARYAEQLSEGKKSSKKIISGFIKRIFTLQAKHAAQTDFAMAIGLMYETRDGVHCASFGIGEARLISVDEKKSQHLFVWPPVGALSQDRFNADCNARVDEVLGRATVFNSPVNRGQSLIGCTWVSEGLLGANGFNPAALNSEIPFMFDAIKEANLRLHRQKCDDVEQHKRDGKFGDDTSVGVVAVPSEDLQAFLREYVQFEELIWRHQEKAHTDLVEKAKLLGRSLKQLKAATRDEALPELTALVELINQTMEKPTQEAVMTLMGIAKDAEGSPSPLIKGLGIALMVLGGALAIIGGFAMSASYCAFLAGLFPCGGR